MKNAVIIGATSGIGRALAYCLGSKGYNLMLTARSERDLTSIQSDLEIRFNCKVSTISLNFADTTNILPFIEQVKKDNYENYYLCLGKITDNDNPGLQEDSMEAIINTNVKSVQYFLNFLLPCLNPAKKQNIFIFSSIAVIRPRGNNILYASSKACLDFYGRALQHKLNGTEIRIKIIRLGYVDTAMTYGKKLLFPLIKAEKVACKIWKSIDSGKRIIYIPWFWRPISMIIKCTPWMIYKKISF